MIEPIPSNLLPIGNAAISYGQSKLAGLGLKYLGWAKQMAGSSPVYPPDPRDACPRLELRALTTDFNVLASYGLDFDMALVWWYYRRQTIGENHQELLLQDMAEIEKVFSAGCRPSPMLQAGACLVQPIQATYREELRHPRVDDPELRVSVGDFILGIKRNG